MKSTRKIKVYNSLHELICCKNDKRQLHIMMCLGFKGYSGPLGVAPTAPSLL